MADRGVKIFGVETISPDLVYLTDEYPTHRACAERGLTHYENLNNLKEVVEQPLPVPACRSGSSRRTARRCARPRCSCDAYSIVICIRSGAVAKNLRRNSSSLQGRLGSTRRSRLNVAGLSPNGKGETRTCHGAIGSKA